MSTDIATLGLKVDSTQVRTATRDLDALGRVGASTASQVEHLLAPLRQLQSLLASLAAAIAVQKLIDYADSWKQIESRIKLVTKTTQELMLIQDKLFASAQRTRTQFEATADLYTKLARSTTSLGASSAQLMTVTETVNKAVAISGTTAASAAAGIFQLSQAMASGSLRGDELNSILENMPRLAEAIATGMGKTVGQLRTLGAEGKLTATQVVEAILSQASVIDAEFGKMAVTVSQAWTTVENAVLRYVGRADSALGATESIADALKQLAHDFDAITDAAGTAGAVLGGVFVARGLAPAVVAIGQAVAAEAAWIAALYRGTAANIDETNALRGLITAALGATTATRARAAAALEAATATAADTAASLENAAAERVRAAALVTALEAEIALENARLAAQITDVGRAARTRALATLTLELAAANRLLATTEAAVVEATAVNTAAQTAAAGAAAAHTAALAGTTFAARAAATAMAGLRAVLAMLGGPVGAAILATAGAVYYLATRQSEAERITDKYADAMAKYGDKAKQAADEVDKLNMAETRRRNAQRDADGAASDMAAAIASLGTDDVLGLWSKLKNSAAQAEITSAQIDFRISGGADIQGLSNRLDEIAKKYPDISKEIDAFKTTHENAMKNAEAGAKAAAAQLTSLEGVSGKLTVTGAAAKATLEGVAKAVGLVYQDGKLLTQQQFELQAETNKLNAVLEASGEALDEAGGRTLVLDLLDRLQTKFSDVGRAAGEARVALNLAEVANDYERSVASMVAASADWQGSFSKLAAVLEGTADPDTATPFDVFPEDEEDARREFAAAIEEIFSDCA